MPKKITTNPKAVEARARKEAKKQAEVEKKKQQEEDEYWKDDDRLIMKKQKRKEEQERKKQEANEKKAVKQALYQEEMGPSTKTEKKLTRAEIEYNLEKQRIEAQKKKEREEKERTLALETKIEENVNRLQVDGLEARTVDEAIAILNLEDEDTSLDKHPEKRMKAAYAAFEEVNLPRLKQENPTLRLSQIKQLLKKEWLKSPENPMNQPHKSLAKGK